MRITVFTPTYNRSYSLPRLYESLKRQTFRDFEWLIVDDGSTDNTTEVVKSMKSEDSFLDIQYLKTENGGKHRAINKGVGFAKGEILFFVDSDDWLREDALEWIDSIEKSIPKEDKSNYAGVQGLRCHTDGSIIGKTFDGDKLDVTTIERKCKNITGDKAEAYYTHIIKKYPFPEFEDEKFATERLVWNQIAKGGYKVRYFNEKIYYCEYLEDGLTHCGNLLYARNPRQWGLAIQQDYQFGCTNYYNTTIQVYIYFMYEKERISMEQIIEYLGFKKNFVIMAILLQSIVDKLRWIFHKGVTIQSSMEKEIF